MEYIDITQTKDGRFFDLTDKGKAFLNNGEFSNIGKEKQKQKYKEYAIRAIFFVLGLITVKAIENKTMSVLIGLIAVIFGILQIILFS